MSDKAFVDTNGLVYAHDSEDLNHKQRYAGLSVVNPFRP